MAIPNYNEVKLIEVLSSFFSPSQEIRDPERLVGREKYLTQIRRALASPGRHIFIYGERGVGKTSLAITSGKLAANENKNFIYVPCGQDTTFYEVIASIGRSVLSPEMIAEGRGPSFGAGLTVFGNGGNLSFSSGESVSIQEPSTMGESYDILRFVRSRLKHQIIIVVDELDRIKDRHERARFAELIKNVGTVVEDMRFVLCGIGANVDELIGEHLSTGRMFEPVDVHRLSQDKLWEIVEQVAREIGVEVPQGHLLRIGVISDGFPHFVHLIGQCIFYVMLDDEKEVSKCSDEHFLAALREATQKAEPSLRQIYHMATEKTKNKRDYEEALWALADRTSTRRQISEIFESSYKRIHEAHRRKVPDGAKSRLEKELLNSRFLRLREDSHANIIVGHGSGWFSFRENVMRGYVRLKAETAGIELVPEVMK